MNYTPRLKEHYRNVVVPAMKEKFEYASIMEVPRIEKICINQAIGAATGDKKLIDNAAADLSMITGQKAIPIKAKRSVSNFKLREGMPIAVRVTLRQNQMYEFLDRLVSVALPRVRDFRGVNDKSFDGRGNYSMGITEHIIFPEIDMDKVTKIIGMDISFVTTAKTDAEAMALLKLMGMPFKNQRN